MKSTAVLAVLPVLVFGCCFPKQWRGTLIDSEKFDTVQMSVYSQIEMATYDDYLKRLVTNWTNSQLQPVLYYRNLYTKEVWHVENGRCTYTKNAHFNVPLDCIPSGAIVKQKSYLDVGSAKVSTTMYHFMFNQHNASMTVTDDGCLPIYYKFEANDEDRMFNILFRDLKFTNMVEFHADAAYFNPPKICMT